MLGSLGSTALPLPLSMALPLPLPFSIVILPLPNSLVHFRGVASLVLVAKELESTIGGFLATSRTILFLDLLMEYT
jgi:hypothetical protein